nr:hypothetical protein [uncultured Lachnoclostridium sp.]
MGNVANHFLKCCLGGFQLLVGMVQLGRALDTSGTELGWFAVYTADPNQPTPLLLVSMAEDVKHTGGSGLVVRKDKTVLDTYLPAAPQ